MRRPPKSPVNFPPSWTWWSDEAIPAWVKKNYSPTESWKSKPFTREDAVFFLRGVLELSELFTEERPKNLPSYFNHPRYRSGYLLYFLPLQAAKFYSLFSTHPGAMDAMIAHGESQGVIRITDVGVGPGTASIAALLYLLHTSKKELPPIELDWIDLQRGIMVDGKALAEQLAESFPKLRGKVTIKTRVANWWMTKPESESSLLLFGNVLNESTGLKDSVLSISRWLSMAKGAGTLFVEPAARTPSQRLSQIRDELLASEVIPESPTTFWGPCLHGGTCPVAQGRDWCHFSMPVEIPGEWFKFFSKGLGSERHWLKYSYLWITSEDHRAPTPGFSLRRVISDPLGKGERAEVLLCEPNQPRKFIPPPVPRALRGAIIKWTEPDPGAAPTAIIRPRK